MNNFKALLLILLISSNAQSFEIDIDGTASFQRGNSFNTILGSNAHYKDKVFDANALYSYSDNDVRIDRHYEVKSNADFPLRWHLNKSTYAVFMMDGFFYGDIGKDTKKNLENYNKQVVGLSYTLLGIKYSVGLGRHQENDKHFFIKTHRLKYSYENESYRLNAVAWYIKNPDDYDISIKGSCKLKITKRLHAGLGVEYSYDSAPIKGAACGDFLSKFIIGISL